MKYLFIFSFIILSITNCKRKQALRELSKNEPLVTMEPQCYNGLKDTNETGVDCGGPCAECNIEVANCFPLNNTLKAGTTTYSLTPNSSGVSGFSYVISGTYDSGYKYVIELGNTSIPNTQKAYTIRDYSPGANEAMIYLKVSSFTSTNLDFFVKTGKVYVTESGGKYYATICDAQGYYSGDSSNLITVEGKSKSF